jgi:hypothetical protein
VTHRYISILRWKRGEKVGLSHVSPQGRNDVVPLFVLGTQQYVGRKATAKRVAVPAPKVFADEVSSIWGNAPFYINAAALPTPPAGHHPIADIAAAARAAGLKLIPATSLSAPPAYQAAVSTIEAIDTRGLALVVDLNEFSSMSGLAGAWPHALSKTDLIVDFEDNVGTVNALGPALNPTFQQLHQGSQWRTVTICGTSMPENFVGYVAGRYAIQRVELALWQRLSNLGLPYRLDYGDYATVPVTPAPAGIRWGFPISVRYSLSSEFLVCRGVGTTGPGAKDMDAQLVAHANTIMSYPTRGALAHCWADTRIDNIAVGLEGPQGLEHWVQIGVNRHVEITRHHLP